jgi:hypothetical protein
MKLFKRTSFTPNPLFVDGLSRSGKAAVAVAISSLKKTEHVQNRFIYDSIMNFYKLGYLHKDAAIEQLIIEADFSLYYSMLGRNLNTNLHDWSSVLNSRMPETYLERTKLKDNSSTAEKIFDEINKSQIITINCCEEMLLQKELFEEAFNFKNKGVVVMRHPIEVIFSWHRTNRGNRFGKDLRFIHPTFNYKNEPIPIDAKDWADEFTSISALDRIIKLLHKLYFEYFEEIRKIDDNSKNYKIIYFENFITNTEYELKDIANFLNTELSKNSLQMCKNQKLPRELNYESIKIKTEAIKINSEKKYYELFIEMCREYEKLSQSEIKIDNLMTNKIKLKKNEDFNFYLKAPDFKNGKRINNEN